MTNDSKLDTIAQAPLSRREAVTGTAKFLSLGTIALLAGLPSASLAGGRPAYSKNNAPQAAATSASGDVDILNVALGLEHEAISAYQIGAQSGLLQKPALDAAVLFQSHHKGHRDALIATIQKLGGAPVEAKSDEEVAKALNAASLKNQTDVLQLAAKLELGAANAYLGVIPAFKDSALAQVAGRLAADETMHWTVLTQVLGQPLPGAPLTFGA